MAGVDPYSVAAGFLLGDPNSAMTMATALGALDQKPDTDVVVTIYDKFYNVVGISSDYLEVRVSMPRQALPTGALKLKGIDPLAEQVLKCDTEVVPVTVEIGAIRWSGRVDVAHDKLNPDGTYTVECELLHDLHWLDRILAWPAPELPIQVQFPTHWFGVGPAITVLKSLIAEQVWRLQFGLWELVNTIGSLELDWRAWFGTLLTQPDTSLVGALVRGVSTPIFVMPTNPLKDTSPWISINGRMNSVWKLCQQTLRDNGLTIEATLWLPGEPQPAPGMPFELTVPTIVIDIKDRSGITGPTATMLDGLVIDLVDLEQSLLGDTLKPLLNPGNEYAPAGVNIAPALGVNFTEPWVLFNADHPRSGLVSHDVAHHHPLAWQLVVGGKSPKWLDDLANTTLEFLIDCLSIVAGFAIPNSILDGMFDDILLAFTLVEHYDRRVALGPYGFPEKFFPTGSGAFTLDAFFAEIQALWDTRGYPASSVSFINGTCYTLGRDLFPGALASVVRRGTLFTDYVENVTISDTRTKRALVEVQIGDGKGMEAPIARIQRKIVGFEELINILTLATQ